MKLTNESKKSLAALTKKYWEVRLAEEPLMATALGEKRFDDRLQDITLQGRLRKERRYESMLECCNAIREDALSDEDRLTRTAFMVDLRMQIDFFLVQAGGLDR